MADIKLGLQAYSVREAFEADPFDTLKKVRAIGYTGVEITLAAIKHHGVDKVKAALAEAGLECYGILTGWSDMSDEKLADTIKTNGDLGSEFLVIGSVPSSQVTNIDEVNAAVARMNEVTKLLREQGVVTGYHNHCGDHTNIIDGKSFFEHIFDNTPEDFVMLLDTGNALEAGVESIPTINKYPNRSPYLHIKGYSKEKGYLAYIGDDDFDWKATIECAIKVGGAKVFDVEFGKRGDYDPFERAESAFKVVSEILGITE